MDVEPTYGQDTHFNKLVNRQADACVITAALELSRDANPDVDFDAVFQWIACRADEVRPEVTRSRSDWDALQALRHCIADQHEVSGSVLSYSEADGSYLDRVIETKRGIPISLSLLYIAVANQAGLPLLDAPVPEHFVTQLETPEGRYFLDPYDNGYIWEEEDGLSFLASRSQLPRHAVRDAAKPGDSRSIIIRMLNNLKLLYVQNSDWAAAWKVQHRLSKLQPGSYEQRRDLGVVALRSKRPGKAVDILRACLKAAPQDDQKMLEGLIEEATSNLVCLN